MIEQLAEMPTYEAYKDSGVEWLGEIPTQTVGRNKRSVSGKGCQCQKRLSAYSGLRTILPPQSDEANDD
ncbi:hypothetical protein GO003_022130 [Methylicorpusculum oleiharenae]|uniref:hypothetical protein n=1 Tax=Methylicorpusculum oleiharenae TaxID=1338687 RepID=UPI0013591D51|nr:hypothetical protein [Methylicorpusculum oleiharenae]MCD2453084.1 hypothetical protein [Methylicorpusculum oleiharenae]